jgi:hypothetical protein
MTDWDSMLSSLPDLPPDTARAARVRAECHAVLGRRPARAQPLEPAAVLGACVIYLFAVVRTALMLYGS